MIIIPGWLVSLITFPGVIVHEAAHMFFCKLRGVAVLDVCFFRIGNPAGYVIHEPPREFTTSFFISIGPFLINSVLCVVFCLPAMVPVRVFGQSDPVAYFLIWLGMSIGMHALPSTGDANGLWREARAAAGSLHPLALASFPLVILIYVANGLRFFWFDYLYGFALGFLLPEMLLKRMV
ncbi:MAG TPA: metalloprotease family protein [Gemmataceae bacterium]|nr:metalloprotease family protein [Gemmataceae bacterium]